MTFNMNKKFADEVKREANKLFIAIMCVITVKKAMSVSGPI